MYVLLLLIPSSKGRMHVCMLDVVATRIAFATGPTLRSAADLNYLATQVLLLQGSLEASAEVAAAPTGV